MLINNPAVPQRSQTSESGARHPETERLAKGDLEARFLLRLAVFEEALKAIKPRRGQTVLIDVADSGCKGWGIA